MKLNASEFNAFIDTAVFLIHNKGNVLKFKDVYFLLKFFFFFRADVVMGNIMTCVGILYSLV